MTIKTIDVTAKEWFDKVNGNSYFSARVVLNYGMDDAVSFAIPFQYGYGDHYIDTAQQELRKRGLIEYRDLFKLWHVCRDNNIILRTQKHENCRKRDVIAYGKD